MKRESVKKVTPVSVHSCIGCSIHSNGSVKSISIGCPFHLGVNGPWHLAFEIININSNLIHYMNLQQTRNHWRCPNLKSQISGWPHHTTLCTRWLLARLSQHLIPSAECADCSGSPSRSHSRSHTFLPEDLLMLSVYILLEDFIYDKPHKTQMS